MTQTFTSFLLLISQSERAAGWLGEERGFHQCLSACELKRISLSAPGGGGVDPTSQIETHVCRV